MCHLHEINTIKLNTSSGEMTGSLKELYKKQYGWGITSEKPDDGEQDVSNKNP